MSNQPQKYPVYGSDGSVREMTADEIMKMQSAGIQAQQKIIGNYKALIIPNNAEPY